jgi:hypothetical protein
MLLDIDCLKIRFLCNAFAGRSVTPTRRCTHWKEQMAIDDKLGKVLDNLSEESQLRGGTEGVAAAIAAIPYAGSVIASLMGGRAKRRVVSRAIEMFEAIKHRLEQLDESKVNIDFFEGEEFQTLLVLALEQLQTTHDKDKLHMLACGLANSGALEFSAETRKEMFVRILRDLSPNHVRVLKDLLPISQRHRDAGPEFWPTLHEPHDEVLAVLQYLAANGLVEESLKSEMKISDPRYANRWTPSDAERAINDALKAAPSRHFRISELGLDFLKYFGLGEIPMPTEDGQ